MHILFPALGCFSITMILACSGTSTGPGFGDGGTSSGNPSSGLAQYCARDQAAGCEDATCETKFDPLQKKCPVEFGRLLQCAASVPACTSFPRCEAEGATARACWER